MIKKKQLNQKDTFAKDRIIELLTSKLTTYNVPTLDGFNDLKKRTLLSQADAGYCIVQGRGYNHLENCNADGQKKAEGEGLEQR